MPQIEKEFLTTETKNIIRAYFSKNVSCKKKMNYADQAFFHDAWLDQDNVFRSCRSHHAICIPQSRISIKILSNRTLNQVTSDLLCAIFASMTASEETFPMTKNVSRDDPCNWPKYPGKKKSEREMYHYINRTRSSCILKSYFHL